MNSFSEWKKIDLHIHSKASNLVKNNDYDGSEYDARTLLDKLILDTNNINIFSVTDHNCINEELYNDLETLINNPIYKDKINYVVGVELDVYDTTIYEEEFHCLCFFDSRDITVITNAVDQIFNGKPLSQRNDIGSYPNVATIFSSFNHFGIKDILLIPHFNNKNKGLPQDIAVENLNYLCFNAYEDSNNVANIQKSLNIYLREGYDNFPFAVFSDNHNLDVYPAGKDGNSDIISCYVLGNLEEPFNSIKTAFQEARMRVSLSSITNMRDVSYPDKYLNELFINGRKYVLSPYQNTIIGKFGSGKSLLLEKIKKGNEALHGHKKYSEFYDEDRNFKIFFNNQQYNSLEEIKNVYDNFKIYEFVQQEDYYYKNFFTLTEAKKLFEQLNIEYDFNTNVGFEFFVDDIDNAFTELKKNVDKIDGKNNLNYGRAFDINNYYTFPIVFRNIDFDSVISELSDVTENLVTLNELSLNGNAIFNSEELKKVNDVYLIVSSKLELLNKIKLCDIDNSFKSILEQYNSEYINNDSKTIKDVLIADFDMFVDSLKNFFDIANKVEYVFTNDIYNSFLKEQIKEIKNDYNISWKYNISKDYKSITSVVKECNRSDCFAKSVLKTLVGDENRFSNNKEFSDLIKKYSDFVQELCSDSNIQYDICYKNDSMLKKSAGEKSSMFIKFIFDLIESDLENGVSILMLLDQPEDNIDNDNIYNQISNRIKNLKLKYKMFQSLIVTHNANVGITADSENIIIAKEKIINNKKCFDYDFGCIECRDYIEKVCTILEGGKKAMERRTIKYGINIIRKVEEHEI